MIAANRLEQAAPTTPAPKKKPRQRPARKRGQREALVRWASAVMQATRELHAVGGPARRDPAIRMAPNALGIMWDLANSLSNAISESCDLLLAVAAVPARGRMVTLPPVSSRR